MVKHLRWSFTAGGNSLVVKVSNTGFEMHYYGYCLFYLLLSLSTSYVGGWLLVIIYVPSNNIPPFLSIHDRQGVMTMLFIIVAKEEQSGT